MIRARIAVAGVVQGVGFRPFVYRLAVELGLTGHVANTTIGVAIEVRGDEAAVARFLARLQGDRPPLAAIDSLSVARSVVGSEVAPTDGPGSFTILTSRPALGATGPVPPDSDLCPACLAELLDPADRRYRYPFITCTDCGPRYTLIEGLPYDRPLTAMGPFAMCDRCAAEYNDPANRRFHAQTNCCPECGPRLELTDRHGRPVNDPAARDAAAGAAHLLHRGGILAVKGIGGFHLAVDATNTPAVALLRQRKNRPDKPLAVMVPDLVAARRLARPTPDEAQWLRSRQKPIVLLRKRQQSPLAANVAPHIDRIGVMLPYTPLHHLLFQDNAFPALVMTSGNRSGDPIARENGDALARLGPMVDAFLLHDRDILVRTDDSVLMVRDTRPVVVRRSRSFVPSPIRLATDCGNTLALGGLIKNTVCLTRGREALLSQHLGDLDRPETLDHQQRAVARLLRLLAITPDLLVYDSHPDDPGRRRARQQPEIASVAVQHHHAHVVSCMAEHQLHAPVIGVALDGTGHGPDNTIWGGEVLIATPGAFRRAAHLEQVHLPGGEAAIRHPWRMAVSHLYGAFGADLDGLDLNLLRNHRPEIPVLLQMMRQGINAPLTSSCGRLFDAVAALAGLREKVTFEGQAAMELESLAGMGAPVDPAAAGYAVEIEEKAEKPWIMRTAPIILGVVEDLRQRVPGPAIAGRFHVALARLLAETCRRLRQRQGLDQVVLSGGVFQNQTLLGLMENLLRADGFQVHGHSLVPPNDGGLALGQAVAGRAIFEGQKQ